MSVLSRLVSGPANAPKRVALPHAGGAEASPSFSPDGKRLAFSAREAGGNNPYHIFVRNLSGGTLAQLTSGPASDLSPAWSPDGSSIAFLRVDDSSERYMVLPVAGGEPREVAGIPIPPPQSGSQTAGCWSRDGEEETRHDCDTTPHPRSAVCWTPDGQSLYIVQRAPAQPSIIAAAPAAGGAPRPITRPPAGSLGDSAPAISPDGSTLAFVRQSADKAERDRNGNADGGDIFLSDLSGNNLRRLTFENIAIHGIAWSSDGRDLIYAATRVDQNKLWRVDASGGSPRNVLAAGKYPALPAVSPAGHRLVFVETPALDAIWRLDLTASDPASSARLLIHSDGREFAPRWSPDGTKIANVSSATGNDEIWMGNAEGIQRAPVTHMKAMQLRWLRWSPDGRTILFVDHGNGEVNVERVASDGHTPPVRIPLPAQSHQPSWSHDGQSIYYATMSIWSAHPDGQQQKKLTNNWGDGEPEESADGKYLFFRRDRSIWRIPTAGGTEEEVIKPDHDARWPAYQAAATGLYYLELDRDEHSVSVRFYDFPSKKSRELVRLPVTDPSSASTFSVSPDGRYVLYAAVDHTKTTLVLTENFR